MLVYATGTPKLFQGRKEIEKKNSSQAWRGDLSTVYKFLFLYLKIGQSFAWSLSLSQLCTDCQNNNVSLIWATLHSWNSDSELTATSTTKIIFSNFAFMLHQLHIQESKMLDWSACFWVYDDWAPKIVQCTIMITVTRNHKQYKFQSLFFCLMQYQFITMIVQYKMKADTL